MKEENYKYTIDKIFELFKFVWQHRYGNKNIRAFQIYVAACGVSLAGYGYSLYANSEGKWGFNFSVGEIGLYELFILVVISLIFLAVLFVLNKSSFDGQEKLLLKRIEEKQILHDIEPIKPFSDFNKFNDTHNVSQYIDTNELESRRRTIINNENGHIRLLGLSGTGKTFLIQKAFNETDDTSKVFYCDNVKHPALRSSVESLCTIYTDCTLILDNCPKEIFAEMISSFGSKIRFISAYFDPNDYSGSLYNTLDMNNLSAGSIINDIIDQNVKKSITLEQKKLIIYHSGEIPFMALLLVQAFNSTSQIGIIDNDTLMTHLLDIQGQYPIEQRIAMQTLALCQPLYYNNGNSEMIEYLMNSDRFTPIVNKQLNRELIFSQVVSKLTNRSLIEHDSVFMNVRPQPLAIWLVGEWLKEQGLNLKNTINELSQQPKHLCKNILEAWAKRLEYMQGNQDAEKLYAELMKINGGPFANEDMVCSDFGSRLILAMSTVNPVAASECIYVVLFHKPIEWLHVELNGDARRNIVRALEKLCFCKDSFYKSACLMARLAVAENEEWANNSKGQFLQLFHIALAGTESNLSVRYDVLKYLYYCGKEYHSLILSAIKVAFSYQGFSRMGGAEKFGFKELQDFIPTNYDIDEYWNNLYSLLIEWMNTDESVLPAITDIVVANTRMFVRANHAKLLFRLLEEISPRLNNKWNAMHKALVETKNFDLLTPKDGDILLEWIERLTPSDILGRMRAAIHDLHTKKRISTEILQQEEQVVLPFVKEFVNTESYRGEEMLTLLNDNDFYIPWAFTSNLVNCLPTEDIPFMNNYLLTYIYQQEKNFYSSFLVNFYSLMPKCDAIKAFTDQLYEEKFYVLALPILAVTDDKERHNLQFLISQLSKGILSETDIRRYFRATRLTSSDEILMVAELLKNNEATSSNQQLQFDFLSQYWYLDELYSNICLLNIYKDVLLNYPLDKANNYNYEYTRQVIGVLEKNDEIEFAKQMNRKLIELLSFNSSFSKVEEIYPVLLTKYREVVWMDFIQALVDFDNRPGFFLHVRYEIGSGFDFGEKSLFGGHENEMKQLCRDYPEYGPMICASTCPVFDSADPDTGEICAFHPFAVWLIKNYGDKQYVLDEFHSNMNTFHWTGSTLPLLEDRRRSLENLNQLPNLSEKIREWIKKCLLENKVDYEKESQQEAYINLAYNK